MQADKENGKIVFGLQREWLALKTIINYVSDRPKKDWPPQGIWEVRFGMLKDAVDDGHLQVIRHRIYPRFDRVNVSDVRAYLADRPTAEKWGWLRDFCKIWEEEAGVESSAHSPETAATANTIALTNPTESQSGKARREEQTEETEAKYERWHDIAQQIKAGGDFTGPTAISGEVAKRVAGQPTCGKPPAAQSIRRRLDDKYPGWAQ